MSSSHPAQPGVKRRLQEGDHVVFDVFHRGLVAGATSRLSALQPSVFVGLVMVVFGAAVLWIAGAESPRYPVPSPGDKLAILYAEGIRERVM